MPTKQRIDLAGYHHVINRGVISTIDIAERILSVF